MTYHATLVAYNGSRAFSCSHLIFIMRAKYLKKHCIASCPGTGQDLFSFSVQLSWHNSMLIFGKCNDGNLLLVSHCHSLDI